MTNEKCVYCLTDKPMNEFNIEHVVPRMFGKYENNFTLSDHQVCQECNTYFCDNIETPISLDSFEAFLRMTKNKKLMSDGRTLTDKRITFSGNSGVLKGIKFRIIADRMKEERIHAEILPCIGLKICDNENEYHYFSPEELPERTEYIYDILKRRDSPIIFFNMDKGLADTVLTEKGYKYSGCKLGVDISEIYSEDQLQMKINLSIDNLLFRLSSKVAFNYFIYKFGKTLALSSAFDSIRVFIRNGTITRPMSFAFSNGGIRPFSQFKGDHAVGLSWGDNSFRSLYGMVSWFGEASYRIPLAEKLSGFRYKLPSSVFQNQNGKIIDFNEYFIN